MTDLTPYDTGEIAEPKPWCKTRGDVQHAIDYGVPDRIGKVDFENDESATVVTIQVIRGSEGKYAVVIEPHEDVDVIFPKSMITPFTEVD